MVTSYKKQDKTLIILLNEEIDQDTVDKIKRDIDDEIEKYIPKKVIFDFTNITFMDSSGIGMILGRYKLVRIIDGEMEIINVNRIVKRIFDMSGIERIIKIDVKKDENDKNRFTREISSNYINEYVESEKNANFNGHVEIEKHKDNYNLYSENEKYKNNYNAYKEGKNNYCSNYKYNDEKMNNLFNGEEGNDEGAM